MKILRSENESQVQRDVNANAIIKIPGQDFMLEDGDIVQVPFVKPGISNKIEIRGEVTYPGVYELRKGSACLILSIGPVALPAILIYPGLMFLEMQEILPIYKATA